jgi:ApbE superfamily uncharacterized protein (UPF0280 family)
MNAQRLAGGRLHLHHGPIDVVLKGDGPADQVAAAEDAAARRFATILDELVAELPLLRAPQPGPPLAGAVAQRMAAGCAPFARQGIFVTAMAAVAGAVADELLATMRAAAPGLSRAFVNDGGDIAVFVAPGAVLDVALAADTTGRMEGALRVTPESGIGGIATSGRHGRSFSLGIADAVTVVARDAATADAAATLLANAVDVASPAITRVPAESLDPDSDLGTRLVTTQIDALTEDEIAAALAQGAALAARWIAQGHILGAALRLAGAARVLGADLPLLLGTSP